MSDHFAAFSFVDRITEFVPGVRGRGVYHVPADLPAFPACLVAEATGQLAAWVAMEHIGFRGRPVAALATETRFHADVPPGSVLELTVDIDQCDDDAVAYSGRATCHGALVVELIDCLGPMLPVAEFDSPEALTERLALLRGAGAPAGRFRDVAAPQVERGEFIPGESLVAKLHVPVDAPFFADHFPRRAVFPATLLLDAEIGIALELARSAPDLPAGSTPQPVRMTHVKVRSFTAPGATLDVTARRVALDGGAARIMLTTEAGGKTVATARLEVEPRMNA